MPLSLIPEGGNEMDNWNQLKFANMADPKESSRKNKRTQELMVQCKQIMKSKIKSFTTDRALRQQHFA